MSDKKRLGEMLIEKGLIDEFQLKGAIARQKSWGNRLGANLVSMGHISEITLLKFLSSQLKYPAVDLAKIIFTQPVYSLVKIDIAKKHTVIPVEIKESGGKKELFVAMADPTDFMAIDELSFLTGHKIKPVIATKTQLEGVISKYYDGKGWIRIEPLKELEKKEPDSKMEIIHEITLKEKKAIIEQEEEQEKQKIDLLASQRIVTHPASEKNHELLALVRILIKKGIITKDEFGKELSAVKKQK